MIFDFHADDLMDDFDTSLEKSIEGEVQTCGYRVGSPASPEEMGWWREADKFLDEALADQ